MFVILLTLHVLICLVLVVAILIQSGKGGGLVSAFGTSGGHAIFGGRGAATFLSKATTILGAGFMVTSLLLAVLSGAGVAGGQKKGALEKEAERAGSEVPQSLPPAGQSPFAPGGAEAPAGGAGGPGTTQGMPAPSGTPGTAAPMTAPGAPSATPGGAQAPAPSGAGTPPAQAPSGKAPSGQAPQTPPAGAGSGH
jgi:preprotein translocase subunit SecG